MIPLYSLVVIADSLHAADRTLLGLVTEVAKEITKENKLIEIIGMSECCIENLFQS